VVDAGTILMYARSVATVRRFVVSNAIAVATPTMKVAEEVIVVTAAVEAGLVIVIVAPPAERSEYVPPDVVA
jgi:hypothetical protein